MQLSYGDHSKVSKAATTRAVRQLTTYRAHVQSVIEKANAKQPEYSLALWRDEVMQQAVYEVTSTFTKVKHVVLIGIGGSSLGVEAMHSVLATAKSPELHILDTIAPYDLEQTLAQLAKVKNLQQLAVCVVSKSGSTTETLSNAEVVLGNLQAQFGKAIYKQTIVIGDSTSPLLKAAKKLKAHTVAMPAGVGGRYSVFTPVGLVPLQLLGHDTEAILSGLEDATSVAYEEVVAESAAKLYLHLKAGVRHVNFFAFDTRLVRLGKWYRQLAAESLGKEKTKKRKLNKLGFVPTISTPVELHSVGQLYLSGFAGVYTDFVTFDDEECDFALPKKPLVAGKLKGKSLQDIATAIYGGVIGAYQSRRLPYRSTIFDEELDYSLGLFMGMRMLETMYVAHLMDVNAFDQPNVELYKTKTKKILKLT